MITNIHGSAILEVLVAAGILGVISLGMMKMSDEQGKISKKMRTDYNVTNLMYELEIIRKNPQACQNTFNALSNRNLTTLPRNLTIRNQSNDILVGPGVEIGTGSGGSLTVDTVQIISSNPAISTGGSTQNYDLTIRMQFTRNGVKGGAQNFEKTTTIGFVDNDGNGVVDFTAGDVCKTDNVVKSAVCDALGGTVVSISGQDRCANIDIFNDEADGTTPGDSQYFGVMSRGGIAITEDRGTNIPRYYWSIIPTDQAISDLQFRIDDSNEPDIAGTAPLLSLESRDDGTESNIIMNAEEYNFGNEDNTQIFLDIGPAGGVGIGRAGFLSSTGAMLNVSPYDVATQDGIRVQTNAANSDIYLVGRGSISADSNLFFAIDADNNTTDAAFFLGANGKGTAATTRFTIRESGNVGIGTTNPGQHLDIFSTNQNVGVMVRDTQGNGNTALRLKNGDLEWQLQTRGGAGDNFVIMNRTNNRMNIKISPTASGGITFGNTGNLTNASGALDIYDGDFYLYRTSAQIGNQGTGQCTGNSAGADNCRVVNRGWVKDYFSGAISSFTSNQREAIVNNLLSTTNADSWTYLRDNAEAHIFDAISVTRNNFGGGPSCPAGQFVRRIRYTDPGSFQISCGNPLGCGVRGNCSNVYAGAGGAGRVCIRNAGGNWDCVAHGQVTWPNNCVNVTSAQGGFTSARYANCPNSKMIREVRFLSGGQLRITCCNNELLVDE